MDQDVEVTGESRRAMEGHCIAAHDREVNAIRI
jgi:hypothetical protein